MTERVELPPRPLPAINTWVVCLGAVLVGATCLWMGVLQHQPRMTVVAKTDAIKLEPVIPKAQPAPPAKLPTGDLAPRAEPVAGPLTAAGEPMLSGHQYHVAMPDGRTILINYRGWVDHACNLPRQRGINNAAYTEAATGHTWIWTVPAGTSNVPRWIDP